MSASFAETVELIASARAGDNLALRSVVERYRPALLERVRLMMGPEARSAAESQDFLQELFVEIVRDFDSLQRCDERSFLRWATTLARNNIRDSLRRRRERAVGHFASSIDWRPAGGPDASEGPDVAAEHQEQVERLVDALCELPEDHKLVLELRHFERLPFGEIGLLLGRSQNAVQLLHHRALLRLGQILR